MDEGSEVTVCITPIVTIFFPVTVQILAINPLGASANDFQPLSINITTSSAPACTNHTILTDSILEEEEEYVINGHVSLSSLRWILSMSDLIVTILDTTSEHSF